MAAELSTMATYAAGGAAAVGAWLTRVKPRLELSSAKHKSLSGHVRMAKRVAGLIPFYDYDETRFFCCDGAPEAIARQRQAGGDAFGP